MSRLLSCPVFALCVQRPLEQGAAYSDAVTYRPLAALRQERQQARWHRQLAEKQARKLAAIGVRSTTTDGAGAAAAASPASAGDDDEDAEEDEGDW